MSEGKSQRAQFGRQKTVENYLKLCYKTNGKRLSGTIELWMHLGGWLSTQEARVALVYRLERLLRFFSA